MARRLEMFLSNVEMMRFLELTDHTAKIDVHGMRANDMKKFLKNVVAAFLGMAELEIIHGYRNGTSLADALREEGLFSKPYHIEEDENNKGVTRIIIGTV